MKLVLQSEGLLERSSVSSAEASWDGFGRDTEPKCSAGNIPVANSKVSLHNLFGRRAIRASVSYLL